MSRSLLVVLALALALAWSCGIAAAQYQAKPDHIVVYNEYNKTVQCLVKETGGNLSVDPGGHTAHMTWDKKPRVTLECNPWGQPDLNLATFPAELGKVYIISAAGARTPDGTSAGAGTGRAPAPAAKSSGDYSQIPGKVVIYNETNRSVELTIVGQESNMGIDPHGRFAQTFNPKAPTELAFWFFGERGKEIGRVSVTNGGVYVVRPSRISTVIKGDAPAKSAADMAAPDFTNPESVYQDLHRREAACKASGNSYCVNACKYAVTTLQNFLRLNPEGDSSIFKQRWQTCYNASTQ